MSYSKIFYKAHFLTVIFCSVLVGSFVSVLISLGLASQLLTNRLANHHEVLLDNQKLMVETLQKKMKNMTLKEEQVKMLKMN